MLPPLPIPGLIITGTDTGVGKTLIAGAIARWFLEQRRRIAVCKPVATGCIHRREGLVSEDAEFLALCSNTHHPLDLICPQRFAEPLAPAVAAQRAGQPLEWEAIGRAISLMSQNADAMIVEGVGGIMVPMDEKHTFLDVAGWLRIPAVVVCRAGLGAINHTLLTLAALRSRRIAIAGIVINRYPTDTPGLAEETNPKAIEKYGKAPILCITPEEKLAPIPDPARPIPLGVRAAIASVDWEARCGIVREERPSADLSRPRRRG